MNNDNMFKLQKLLVYLMIAASVVLFVIGLGFMTNFYPLFYNGTSDMYDYFKRLQILNKAEFNMAVVMVVMTVLMLGFDLNKPKNGWIGLIYSAAIAVYVWLNSLSLLRAIPYYKGYMKAWTSR